METAPINQSPEKPAVIIWYKVYLGFFVFLYLAVAALGVVPMVAPITAEDMDGLPPVIMGVVYLVFGLFFAIPMFAGFFLGRKPWVWIFHLVIICLGLTSCTLVFSIPLLIFWLKPDVKTYYGRDAS